MQRGHHLEAAILAGAGVFCLCFAALAVLGLIRPVTVRGAVVSGATVLRADRAATALVIIAFIAVIPSGVLYVLNVPRGTVDLPLGRGGQTFGPLLVGALVLFAAGGLIGMARRRGTGHVEFSTEGFAIVDITRVTRGAWTDVANVTDESPDQRKRYPIMFVMRDRSTVTLPSADGYAPRGAPLYWMVRHYWLHPENRAELADGRALERLRSQDFVPE
ncbi:hypothetical protein JRC04_28670 [Mycolicibacterium sp. S2-37]|nr:hypothetical protein [Mycolicibacterium sp. S2-37]